MRIKKCRHLVTFHGMNELIGVALLGMCNYKVSSIDVDTFLGKIIAVTVVPC